MDIFKEIRFKLEEKHRDTEKLYHERVLTNYDIGTAATLQGYMGGLEFALEIIEQVIEQAVKEYREEFKNKE